jgi:hypothetical protein
MRINRFVARHWRLLSSPFSSAIHVSFGVFLQPQRGVEAPARLFAQVTSNAGLCLFIDSRGAPLQSQSAGPHLSSTRCSQVEERRVAQHMHPVPIHQTSGQTFWPDFVPMLAMQQYRHFFQVGECRMPYKIPATTCELLHVMASHARLGKSFFQTQHRTPH